MPEPTVLLRYDPASGAYVAERFSEARDRFLMLVCCVTFGILGAQEALSFKGSSNRAASAVIIALAVVVQFTALPSAIRLLWDAASAAVGAARRRFTFFSDQRTGCTH
jgi:hypothetical protein